MTTKVYNQIAEGLVEAMEEVANMEAEEKLVEQALNWIEANKDGMITGVEQQARKKAFVAGFVAGSKKSTILSAAEAFISEAERMGWAERSETAIPASFDRLIQAVREARNGV